MNGLTRKLDQLLQAPENEHLEFKAARQKYDYDKLGRYCSALANEGGAGSSWA